MTDKLYRIRKLVWEQNAMCDNVASTPFGRYLIGDYKWEQGYGWCLMRDEDFVIRRVWADTKDLCKLAAEAHWVSRVESCLEEVPQ